MSGLDTSQAMTDEVSLHAAEHHAHSLPKDGEEPTGGEKTPAAATPAPTAEQADA